MTTIEKRKESLMNVLSASVYNVKELGISLSILNYGLKIVLPPEEEAEKTNPYKIQVYNEYPDGDEKRWVDLASAESEAKALEIVDEFKKRCFDTAKHFRDVLAEWLDEDEFKEMLEKNIQEPQFCASHEYCDSNMAMHEAFTRQTGKQLEVGEINEPITHLVWHLAWEIGTKPLSDIYFDKH